MHPAEYSNQAKVAWTVDEWKAATGLGNTTVFELLRRKELRSVAVGRRRLVLTSPAEYLNGLARGQGGNADAA